MPVRFLGPAASGGKAVSLVLTLVWSGFFGYWAVAACRRAPARPAEVSRYYLVHALAFVLAFALTLTGWLRFGFLGERFLPESPIAPWAGASLAVAGLGYAVWARRHLGRYWSAPVMIREGHRLIRTGPYALARHPIYTGILLGMVGTALAVGEWRGLLAVFLLLAAYLRKIRREESSLLEHFGEEYARYRREVKALIPFLL
jgi:protein-S-isoprenylcysteine O-methyltransferase Ste14